LSRHHRRNLIQIKLSVAIGVEAQSQRAAKSTRRRRTVAQVPRVMNDANLRMPAGQIVRQLTRAVGCRR
jgi:hypothetical protein